MKTCPYCNHNLDDGADYCENCKRSLKPLSLDTFSGCVGWLTNSVFTIGLVACIIGGFFWWPVWILAIVLLLVKMLDRR